MASGILMTVKDKVTQVGICHQFSTAGPLKKDSKLFKRQLRESSQSPVPSSHTHYILSITYVVVHLLA